MKAKEKEEARELRRLGKSIKYIADTLHVAKSSVSTWVRDVPLTDMQINALDEHGRFSRSNLLESIVEARRKQREGWVLKGFNRARTDDEFRIICALYWGEGTKDKNSFRIANADAAMLKIVANWLIREGYADKITFVVQFYEPSTETEVKAYWMNQLPLKENNLRKFTQLKCRSPKRNLKYGTGCLIVCSTELVQQIYGGIDFIKGWK